MRKLNIAFGDLNYLNDWNHGAIFVPLSVGNIAAYCLKKFGDAIAVSLHKDSATLFNSLNSTRTQIVALSFYHWNTSLNRTVLRQIRSEFGDEIIICLGGPSIDSDHREQVRLFNEFPEADVFVVNEGEVGFSNIVERVLSSSDPWEHPIDGVVFQRGGEYIRGLDIGLSTDLAELTSPYCSGLLDPYLNSSFLPIIQTSRLCPYTCTFCASGKNKGKLRGFPLEVVKDELTYIAKKYNDHPHLVLNLADDNFGILKRDVEIAEHIRKTRDLYGYPRGLRFYSDKNFGETSKKVVEILGKINKFGANFSLQTETEETLKQINRKNLTPVKLNESISWARNLNIPTSTEFIFGLPGESFDSFVSQLARAVERGFDAINCANLTILNGTEMERKSFREEYNYTSKYRINGSNYGVINDEFCVEYEKIVVSSNRFSYEEFLMVRVLIVMFYAIFTLQFYRWFFHSLRYVGIPIVDFIIRFASPENRSSWPEKYRNFVIDLNRDIKEEFFDSVDELETFAEKAFKERKLEDRISAKLNVFYGARLAFMERDWTHDVLLRHIQEGYGADLTEEQMDVIHSALKLCDKERIDLRNPVQIESFDTGFDFVSWKKENYLNSILDYKIDKSSMALEFVPGSREKIDKLSRNFADYSDETFYYTALELISPRSDTLLKPVLSG
jgi:putative methyltransferase